MTIKKIQWLTWIVLTALLVGCGFRLQGPLILAPELSNTYIQSNAPNSQFTQILTRLLIANGITVVSEPNEATAILKISNVTTSQNLTSLSGGAQAGQYTLYASVVFSAIDNKTEDVLLPPTTVQSSRLFSSNSTQILSATAQITGLGTRRSPFLSAAGSSKRSTLSAQKASTKSTAARQ